MSISKSLDIKVGVFITVGIGLIMISIILLGGADTFFKKHHPYHAYFKDVSGLISGAKVVLSGIRVGTVKGVEFDPENRSVKVNIIVDESYAKWIRSDSTVVITTQGVLGDKFISITPGSLEEPELAHNSEIPQGSEKGLGTLLSSSEQLMVSLKSASDSLDVILKNFEKKNRSNRFFEGMAQSSMM